MLDSKEIELTVTDIFESLKNTLSDIVPAPEVTHDNYNNYIESEKIDYGEIIEKLLALNNEHENNNSDWFTKNPACEELEEIIKSAYYAGADAVKDDFQNSIDDYNENLFASLEESKKEITDNLSDYDDYNAADLMQYLYCKNDNMNLFKKEKPYYVIEKFDTYHKTSFYFSKIYYDKKEALKEARQQNKNAGTYNDGTPASIYKVYSVSNGIYTEVKTRSTKKAA